jgi:multisubunit Na+/H+ antiporter MnhB subunit
MRRSEIAAWAIMVIASLSICISFIIHTYPLGIFVALIVFSIALVIVFIGIDEEVRGNE